MAVIIAGLAIVVAAVAVKPARMSRCNPTCCKEHYSEDDTNL
jgi:hypothetical protein